MRHKWAEYRYGTKTGFIYILGTGLIVRLQSSKFITSHGLELCTHSVGDWEIPIAKLTLIEFAGEQWNAELLNYNNSRRKTNVPQVIIHTLQKHYLEKYKMGYLE